MKMQAKITSKGQITVPVKVRRALGVRAGDKLLFEKDGANICARRSPQARNLVVTAPVFAELLAYPTRDEEFLGRFFRDTNISIDWDLNEAIWRIAGRAFQSYAARRHKQADTGPRRIPADFLIGAHALHHGYGLLTFDDRLYRAAFPRLRILSV